MLGNGNHGICITICPWGMEQFQVGGQLNHVCRLRGTLAAVFRFDGLLSYLTLDGRNQPQQGVLHILWQTSGLGADVLLECCPGLGVTKNHELSASGLIALAEMERGLQASYVAPLIHGDQSPLGTR